MKGTQMVLISASALDQQIVNITHYAAFGKPHSTVHLLKNESKNDKQCITLIIKSV